MAPHTVTINRAPVLTLWAAVVAERPVVRHVSIFGEHRRPAGAKPGKTRRLTRRIRGDGLLGFDADAALTLGKALAGLNAQAKGRSLGIFKPPTLAGGELPRKHGLGEELWINLCGRAIPAKNTPDGVRAVVKDRPIDPASVQAYLVKSFGPDLPAARAALAQLAAARSPEQLAAAAFSLYERFRPRVASGQRGWGQKGTLDLGLIQALADRP